MSKFKYSGKIIKTLSKGGGSKKLAKYKKYIIGILVVGIILFILFITATIFLMSRLWDSAVNTANTNPTISSVIENTKSKVNESLPGVPSTAQDFISNGAIDTAKLDKVYNDLPAQTQQVWKSAMELNINQQAKDATGESLQQLKDLLVVVQQLGM